jgi:hypothetical protein
MLSLVSTFNVILDHSNVRVLANRTFELINVPEIATPN